MRRPCGQGERPDKQTGFFVTDVTDPLGIMSGAVILLTKSQSFFWNRLYLFLKRHTKFDFLNTYSLTEKGKPVESQGRKATGLRDFPKTAGLPGKRSECCTGIDSRSSKTSLSFRRSTAMSIAAGLGTSLVQVGKR